MLFSTKCRVALCVVALTSGAHSSVAKTQDENAAGAYARSLVERVGRAETVAAIEERASAAGLRLGSADFFSDGGNVIKIVGLLIEDLSSVREDVAALREDKSSLKEENALLRKELDDLKEENERRRLDAVDAAACVTRRGGTNMDEVCVFGEDYDEVVIGGREGTLPGKKQTIKIGSDGGRDTVLIGTGTSRNGGSVTIGNQNVDVRVNGDLYATKTVTDSECLGFQRGIGTQCTFGLGAREINIGNDGDNIIRIGRDGDDTILLGQRGSDTIELAGADDGPGDRDTIIFGRNCADDMLFINANVSLTCPINGVEIGAESVSAESVESEEEGEEEEESAADSDPGLIRG